MGFPETLKGSKRKLLSFIKEKETQRLVCSLGGMEILLQSIALVLHVYVMSVFKLPTDLCGLLGKNYVSARGKVDSESMISPNSTEPYLQSKLGECGGI